ncbi:transcriptional regulator TbsP domain-containing protein [Halorarius halobius]|uniref:transcriptional regulator TbsP domain-containing protein n=1 Tax=Halorarius halobius TaxID=2962671 RepID=UPI0020CBCED3|nr:DUF5821 family protein [Halorarius halobius]
MPTDSSLFDDLPGPPLYVSASPEYTRRYIDHRLTTDTNADLLLTDALLDTLDRDRLTISKLQQLLDDGATVHTFEDDTVETAVVADECVRVATPTLAATTAEPFVTTTNPTLADAYRTRFEEATALEKPVAPAGWHDFLSDAETTLSGPFRDAIETAAEMSDRVGTRYQSVSLPGLLCLAAAAHDHQQKELDTLIDTHPLVTTGTISNMAHDLEAAGLINREPVSDAGRGRPPKRLVLEEPLDPEEFADALRTSLE